MLWTMLLGNKSYAAEKPVYSPLNGATFVRKCICRLSSLWVAPMKKLPNLLYQLFCYWIYKCNCYKKIKKTKEEKSTNHKCPYFLCYFLHRNKHTGSKELVHRIFTACIRKDRLSSSCHYVSKVEVCQILEYPFQRSGGMILGTGDAAKRKQDELNVSVHKAAE